jgi:dTDP-4-amino-4,6-dideoxygalactose transaminase
MATYKGRALGSIGHLGCLSFHETKNLVCGEGGALLVNDPRCEKRAEIIREKGTNRSQFFRGEVDKYTWVDVGSSYLPSELNAAFLWAQLEDAERITGGRIAVWETYHRAFAAAEAVGAVRRPVVPAECSHNGHLYYLLLPTLERRSAFIAALRGRGIQTVFHYVPLHSAPHGLKVARVAGSMRQTESLSERLVRLPLWTGVEEVQAAVIDAAIAALGAR